MDQQAPLSKEQLQALSALTVDDFQAILAFVASKQAPKTDGTSVAAQAMITAATSGKDRSKKAEGSGIVKKQRKVSSAKATRPLNSYMAFRANYSPIFSSFQQKAISPLLTMLWHGDFLKAKWAIIAKAYSKIRDQQGKDNANLSGFLALVCPLIGVIAPAEYLTMMGWKLIEEDGGVTLHREFVPDFNSLPVELRTTIASVEDVIDYLQHNGYTASASTAVAAPTLVMAAQPSFFSPAQASMQVNHATTPQTDPEHTGFVAGPTQMAVTASEDVVTGPNPAWGNTDAAGQAAVGHPGNLDAGLYPDGYQNWVNPQFMPSNDNVMLFDPNANPFGPYGVTSADDADLDSLLTRALSGNFGMY